MVNPFRVDVRDEPERDFPIADKTAATKESVKLALEETPFAYLMQSYELNELKYTGQKLPKEELNKKYDLDLKGEKGELFSEAYARKVYEFRERERKREFLISEGFRDSPIQGMVTQLGTGFLAEGFDPIGLSLNIATGFGASQIYAWSKSAKNFKGVAKQIRLAGRKLQRNKLLGEITEGVTGNLIADSFVVHGNNLKQSDAKMEEILAMSVAAGAGFPILKKTLGSLLKRVKNRTVGDDSKIVNVRDEASHDLVELGDEFNVAEAKINQHINQIEYQIETRELDNELTNVGIKQQNIDLDFLKQTKNQLLEIRELIFEAKNTTPEQRKALDQKVIAKEQALKSQITKYKKVIEKIEEIKDKTTDQRKKQKISKLQFELDTMKKGLDHLQNELATETDKFIRNKELFEETQKFLFGDSDFDFMTLKPEQMSRMLESFKYQMQRGIKFDSEFALKTVLKNDEIPRLKYELNKLNRIPENIRSPEILERMDFVEKKIEDLESRTGSIIRGEDEKLYVKYDADENYKGMSETEMKEKVYEDTLDVQEKADMQESFLMNLEEAENAVKCRLGELSGQ